MGATLDLGQRAQVSPESAVVRSFHRSSGSWDYVIVQPGGYLPTKRAGSARFHHALSSTRAARYASSRVILPVLPRHRYSVLGPTPRPASLARTMAWPRSATCILAKIAET